MKTRQALGRLPASSAFSRPMLTVYAPMGLAILLRVASGPTANISYVFVALFALLGRPQAIISLVLCWLFTMLSPGIGPEVTGGSIGRYAIFVAAAASVAIHSGFLRKHMRIKSFTLFTLLFGVFIIGHSLLFSPIVDVSILKALSWTLVASTLVSAWAGLKPAEYDFVVRAIFLFLVGILLLSLPFLALPLGYLRNGTAFQGILNHPQAFGATMALLGAWASARMFGERQPPWSLIAISAASVSLIFLSQARTSGLAMILGLTFAIVFSPLLSGQRFQTLIPGLRSGRVLVTLSLTLVGLIALAPKVAELVGRFIMKSHLNSRGLLDSYERSRGFLIDAMLANIEEHPLRGIGFGIASTPSQMVVERDAILGLPVGAPIEKGIAPIAVLEELGAVGALIALAWVFIILRNGARGGLAPFAVALTALALNMGENTLFSPGGAGMLVLVLLAWAHASGLVVKRDAP